MIYKIVLCGDFGVGKSALIVKLCKDTFTAESASTIGASYFCTSIGSGNDKLAIWDTAGQERFSSLLPMYFRGAQAVIYCAASNEVLNTGHLKNTLAMVNPNTLVYLVLTKCDLPDVITTVDNVQKIVRENSIRDVYQTSAKTGKGVHELFDTVYASCKEYRCEKEQLVQLTIEPSKSACPNCV